MTGTCTVYNGIFCNCSLPVGGIVGDSKGRGRHSGSVRFGPVQPPHGAVSDVNLIWRYQFQARASDRNEYRMKRTDTPRKYQAALSFLNNGSATTANGIETIADRMGFMYYFEILSEISDTLRGLLSTHMCSEVVTHQASPAYLYRKQW